MSRFTDRCVVITGAASGIGRASALRMAGEGGRIVSLDVADGGGAETVRMIESQGGSALAIECDVADSAGVDRAIAAASEWGGAIHALVNCAGTGFYRRFPDTTDDEMRRTMRVNFEGPFFTCRAALPALLAVGGAVVNIASAAALRGSGYLSAYSASKGALVAFTKTLAVEYGRQGLRANCVAPGAVDTPLLRLFERPPDAEPWILSRSEGLMGRMARPDEIAASVAFLASDDASHITGAVLQVDAGSLA
jgi:NAD(P)-dependent dehydrogenase (short-subunit alcohol dehydrogenase family)